MSRLGVRSMLSVRLDRYSALSKCCLPGVGLPEDIRADVGGLKQSATRLHTRRRQHRYGSCRVGRGCNRRLPSPLSYPRPCDTVGWRGLRSGQEWQVLDFSESGDGVGTGSIGQGVSIKLLQIKLLRIFFLS